jgi:alpha-L-rhamnosidase
MPLEDSAGLKVIGMQDHRLVIAIRSGTYRFVSSGGIPPAANALKTSKPVDLSLNPDRISIDDARKLIAWDFRQPDDLARWKSTENLSIKRQGETTRLISSGGDPQLFTEFDYPLQGPVVVELRARPEQGTQAQFFWASPDGGFNAVQQSARRLKPTDRINSYLFRIGDRQPLKKLRFDPFANSGEMEIESLVIYETPGN